MRRTTISHFYFLIANPRRCPPCLGKSAFHLRRRVPDEAIPPSPPQMRLREQTGWGFAGTLLKKGSRERGRKQGLLQKEQHQIEVIEKRFPRKGTKTSLAKALQKKLNILKKGSRERGRKQPKSSRYISGIQIIEKRFPRKGTKTSIFPIKDDFSIAILKKGSRERGRKHVPRVI